ncbi:response regulator transcription factor [Erysipelotrichaceae bacterium OttesenSCG-928-M19]|nr:response regulator transcription factor [Erysipelotrichaceae bacterium OttesenSCG-928-M19]
MKVILIDDDSLVTLSLKTILEAEKIEVVALGIDGSDALPLYKKYHPDIILMDIRMKNKNGIEATKDIIEYDKNAKILLLTTFQDDEYIIEALKLGVKGYLLKQDYNSLIPALKSIMANQSVFVADIMHKLPHLVKSNSLNNEDNDLSAKELEVIECIAQGLNNKEIAQELFLSEGTIRNYISSILTKLELRDRTQIAIYYYTKLN